MSRGTHIHTSTGDGPEVILANRFARGEIDEAEYTERLAVLKKGRM